MINPFEFFSAIYCINLDTRPDRWSQVQKEFDNVGIKNVIRVSGKIFDRFNDNKRNACVGNHLSHAYCIEMSYNLYHQNCLIFEDDVQFLYDKNTTWDIMRQIIEELPDNWDMLYLGGNMDKYKAYRFSEHLVKVDGILSTHAYSINRNIMQKLIIINKDISILHNDTYYADNIIPKHNVFIVFPMLAGQRTGYSDIENKNVDYTPMMLERLKNALR